MARGGIEPPTQGFSILRSNDLTSQYKLRIKINFFNLKSGCGSDSPCNKVITCSDESYWLEELETASADSTNEFKLFGKKSTTFDNKRI